LTLEAERVKHYEARIVQAFDHILAVSEPDAAMLWSVCPKTLAENGLREKMTVIPIAVDTTTLSVTRRRPHSTNILTLGTLHYPPNADGIRWFANEVFPLILQKEPAATLTIAGKNPPADFLQIAARSKGRIRVTGYVPDLTPLMEEAALVAVPVRAGGGIRVRILEAFARAMPVVTTTVGLEGIQARPGEDVLVEDDTDGQATAVIQLIRDEALQDRLARNGRKLAEEKYDWQIVLEALDEVYERIRKLPA
jgi:glycosyltransferase involved in cell wall biosynthesis